jgi:hypothetical protein
MSNRVYAARLFLVDGSFAGVACTTKARHLVAHLSSDPRFARAEIVVRRPGKPDAHGALERRVAEDGQMTWAPVNDFEPEPNTHPCD